MGPIYGQISSKSNFKNNGDSFAIVEGSSLPIRVWAILREKEGTLIRFCFGPGIHKTRYTTEVGNGPAFCLPGGWYSVEEYRKEAAKLKAYRSDISASESLFRAKE